MYTFTYAFIIFTSTDYIVLSKMNIILFKIQGMDLRFIEQIDVSSRFTPCVHRRTDVHTHEWEAMLTDLRFEKKLRIRRWTMIYRSGIKLRIPVDGWGDRRFTRSTKGVK